MKTSRKWVDPTLLHAFVGAHSAVLIRSCRGVDSHPRTSRPATRNPCLEPPNQEVAAWKRFDRPVDLYIKAVLISSPFEIPQKIPQCLSLGSKTDSERGDPRDPPLCYPLLFESFDNIPQSPKTANINSPRRKREETTPTPHHLPVKQNNPCAQVNPKRESTYNHRKEQPSPTGKKTPRDIPSRPVPRNKPKNKSDPKAVLCQPPVTAANPALKEDLIAAGLRFAIPTVEASQSNTVSAHFLWAPKKPLESYTKVVHLFSPFVLTPSPALHPVLIGRREGKKSNVCGFRDYEI